MVEKQLKYISYLLRLWQEERDGELVWRASVETPGPGERKAFSSLEALIAFLEVETGQSLYGEDQVKGDE